MTLLLETKVCLVHTPRVEAISTVGDAEYTFCVICESNIDRFWIFDDYDCLPFATEWSVSK
jgi:hypothetical protein